MQRIIKSTAIFMLACCALWAVAFAALSVQGCAGTPQAKIDAAEVLYGNTLGELNAQRQAGTIDAGTWVNAIMPAQRVARQAIDDAAKANAAGNVSAVKLLLETANHALLEIQKYRLSQQKQSSGTIQAMPPAGRAMAAIDPLTVAMSLLLLIQKLAPVIGKLVRGEELSEEERALAQQYSADQTALAQKLETEAKDELAQAGNPSSLQI